MSKKWISTLLILLSINPPCLAQISANQQENSRHSFKPTHADSHTKHHQVNYKNPLNKNAVKTTTAQLIPQPQFDSSFITYPVTINSQQDLYSVNNIDNNTENSNDTVIKSSAFNQTLTTLAYKTVETLHYSTYKFGGTVFNPTQGIYKVDCSAYINDLLSQANPQVYSTLTHSTQTYKPTTKDYFNFFTRLPIEQITTYWRKIIAVDQLQPGGIIVFREQNRHSRYTRGHVMVVMSKPILHPTATNIYQVKVADSAASGHSNDTRLPHHSGIGIGTLLLKADPITGKPMAYAWRLTDHWRNNAAFAMAQPMTSF